jgi:hypothetical protein
MSVTAPPSPTRRKTYFELDFTKVEEARREQRRKLVELLHTPGVLDLNNPDVMAGAWR